MKIGQKYLCKEGFAGHNISGDKGQIIIINERNINDCEGLINAGFLAEIEQVPEAELPSAIQTDPTLDLDEGKFIREKKRGRRTSRKE